MGVHTREQVTYMQIGANGDIRLTVPEGTTGAVRREYEDRETKELKHKFEMVYSAIDGLIGDITIMAGKFGDNLIVPLKDVASGEVITLSVGLTSNFGEDFMKKMPNIDYSKPVVITPFSFTSDKGKAIKGVDIKQDGEKVKNYFRDDVAKKNINGLPEPDGDTRSYTKDDWKIYFLTTRKFLINFNKTAGYIKERAAVAAASAPLVPTDMSESVMPEYPEDEINPEDVPF